jgi:hypothetical protein
MPFLHVVVGPNWRHEHGPLMNLEDGAVYPGGANIIHYGDDGVWCPLVQLKEGFRDVFLWKEGKCHHLSRELEYVISLVVDSLKL